MPLVASKITRSVMDAARTVSESTIRVHGIVVSNATASVAEVVFTDTDDTPILNITCPANDSEHWTPVWIADNGLKITSVGDADVVVTVAHSADGA